MISRLTVSSRFAAQINFSIRIVGFPLAHPQCLKQFRRVAIKGAFIKISVEDSFSFSLYVRGLLKGLLRGSKTEPIVTQDAAPV